MASFAPTIPSSSTLTNLASAPGVTSEEEGLRVILSPVQLAAVIEGEDLSPQETLSNRLWGGAKIIGGALELAGSATLFLAPEPTTTTKVGGAVLGAHGIDTFSSGAREVWTGKPTKTLTQQGGEALARQFGANNTQAERAGIALDIAVPVLVGAITAALRAASIRAGRIVLEEHEGAKLGHTILKHIGKTEPELRARLAIEKYIPAASSFESLKVAEGVLSEAIRKEAPLIRAWAKSGNAASYKFVYKSGRNVGYGVVRSTGLLTKMQNVRIVLKAKQIEGKLYFIFTSFPEP